jgi:hypothetical protein
MTSSHVQVEGDTYSQLKTALTKVQGQAEFEGKGAALYVAIFGSS